jgi:hypothetical protein
MMPRENLKLKLYSLEHNCGSATYSQIKNQKNFVSQEMLDDFSQLILDRIGFIKSLSIMQIKFKEQYERSPK